MRHHNLQVTGSVVVNGLGVATTADLNTYTASADAKISTLQAFTSSVGTTNTFTASASSRLNSIETITASNIGRLNSLENKTGSLATTGSNTFIGTQTITGSLFISSDLVVQGSSSLQNITASAVSIGTNIVNLNTANPAIRYAGLSIGDSGSVGGSGSFLYDSVQDEMIFVHRGANTTVTSSVVLMGPQTYDNIGNEIYPTSNIIQKGTGNEHLVDSCIIDDGTTVCVKGNFIGTGTACFSSTICTPKIIINNDSNNATSIQSLYVAGAKSGYATYCGLWQNQLHVYDNSALGIGNGGAISFGGNAGGGQCTWYGSIEGYKENATSGDYGGALVFRTRTNGCPTPAEKVRITSTGIACFACQVCAPQIIGTQGVNVGANALGADRMFQVSGTSFTSGTTRFTAVFNPSFDGTITNVYGIYGGNNFGTGTITNSYNLYIEGTSAGSATITNRYGLYQAGGSDKNYFAGKVGIGTSSPNETLDVNGTIQLRGSSEGYATTQCVTQVDFYANAARILSFGGNASTCGAFRFYSAAQNNAGGSDVVYIDGAGTACFTGNVCSARILTRSQPNATLGINSGYNTTATIIPWNVIHNNNGGHYNSSTGLFTVPVAGHYLISVMVMTDTSDVTLDLELRINGGVSNAFVPYSGATGSPYNQAAGLTILPLSANDTIGIRLNSGSIYGGASGRHSSVVFRLLG